MHVPQTSKRRESGELAIMRWEEKWKTMMSDFGKDAKIPE